MDLQTQDEKLIQQGTEESMHLSSCPTSILHPLYLRASSHHLQLAHEGH